MKKKFTVVLAVLAIFLLASCAPTLEKSNDKVPAWLDGKWAGEVTDSMNGIPGGDAYKTTETFKAGWNAAQILSGGVKTEAPAGFKCNALLSKNTYTVLASGPQKTPEGIVVDTEVRMTITKLDDNKIDYKYETKSTAQGVTITYVSAGVLAKVK